MNGHSLVHQTLDSIQCTINDEIKSNWQYLWAASSTIGVRILLNLIENTVQCTKWSHPLAHLDHYFKSIQTKMNSLGIITDGNMKISTIQKHVINMWLELRLSPLFLDLESNKMGELRGGWGRRSKLSIEHLFCIVC